MTSEGEERSILASPDESFWLMPTLFEFRFRSRSFSFFSQISHKAVSPT